MSSETSRLRLPLLFPSQALKHVTINDAMATLDSLVFPQVPTPATAQPPAAPADGELHIVGAGASGAWSGLAGRLAQWRDGGWVVHLPQPGWAVRVASEGQSLRVWDGTAWTAPEVRCRKLSVDGLVVGHGGGDQPTNTVVGHGALTLAGSGTENTAVGQFALSAVSSGSQNSAFGRYALGLNSTGQLNTAVGQIALLFNSTGSYNTAVGQAALYANTTGGANTAVGVSALSNTTVGIQNTATGLYALLENVSGCQNTAVGHYALSSGATRNNCTGIGHNAQVTGDNQVQLGDSNTTVYVYGTVQNRSDARDKTDIRDTVFGLAFIRALRPVDFRWDLREDYGAAPRDGSKARRRFHSGLLAQEVAAAAAAHGHDFGGLQHHACAGGADVMSLGYDALVAPLIKAVQELALRVEQLEGAAGVHGTGAAAQPSERSLDPSDVAVEPGHPGWQSAPVHQAGPARARARSPRRGIPRDPQRPAS